MMVLVVEGSDILDCVGSVRASVYRPLPGFPKKRGPFWSSDVKSSAALGPILGPPIFWKLPFSTTAAHISSLHSTRGSFAARKCQPVISA